MAILAKVALLSGMMIIFSGVSAKFQVNGMPMAEWLDDWRKNILSSSIDSMEKVLEKVEVKERICRKCK